MEEQDWDRVIQTVTLVTRDGRRLVFSGRWQIDPQYPPKIVGIEVSRGVHMPDGCKWELTGGSAPPAEQEVKPS